ncbi:MAG: hypothetical protein OQK46_04615 [Gammaproteobacteria bacterium]|nr:hypothetical protein [Gammaproteobacteria bacterium]
MSIKKISSNSWPAYIQPSDSAGREWEDRVLTWFISLMSNEQIPLNDSFITSLKKIYIPFSKYLTKKHIDKPLIIGINGAQGSGKSTLSKITSGILEKGFGKKVISISIDDLYKGKQQRRQLASQVHPLLITRGVPGTHNTELGISILLQLLNKNTSDLLIPVFDKSIDDLLPTENWKKVKNEYDIILFEGWCVGSAPQTEKSLKDPINDLERSRDSDGTWRRFVNQQLESTYAELFSLIDIQVMLKIPSFNKIFEWRKLQEEKLKLSLNDNNDNNIMNDAEIKQFIMHFERLTRHTLNEMPHRSDIVLEPGNDHQIKNVILNNIPQKTPHTASHNLKN